LRPKKRVDRERASLNLVGLVVRVMVARVVMVMVVMMAGKSRHRDQNHHDKQQGQELFHARDYSHDPDVDSCA
jgi:hypothetical protein